MHVTTLSKILHMYAKPSLNVTLCVSKVWLYEQMLVIHKMSVFGENLFYIILEKTKS